MCKNKEEKDMATKALNLEYTLNEDEALKILNTPRKVISQSNVFNDMTLSHKEKIQHASNILKTRK